MTDKKNLLYDFIIQNEIATEDEITLVTCIAGWNEDTMNDIIFHRTGNRSIEQCQSEGYYVSQELLEAEGLAEDEEDEDEDGWDD